VPQLPHRGAWVTDRTIEGHSFVDTGSSEDLSNELLVDVVRMGQHVLDLELPAAFSSAKRRRDCQSK